MNISLDLFLYKHVTVKTPSGDIYGVLTADPGQSRKRVWAKSVFLYLRDARRTADPAAPRKKRDLGFFGFYHLIIEPVASHSRGTLMEAATTKSIQPLIRLVRYIGYILRPNSFCSVCGRKVREYWRPFLAYVVDDGVAKTLKPFDPVQIGCELCDPFFLGLNEEEKRRTFYIV